MLTDNAPILIAPDSFKGTYSSVEVAEALATGLVMAGLTVDRCPVADGGEGTLEALLASLDGALVEVDAHDPLGRPMRAAFGLSGDGKTAVVETASASGLPLLAEAERDAWAASTSGTGELIAAAAAAGAETVLVAVGGSATTDGGVGALDAIQAAGGIGATQLVVLCDVTTPFEQAAVVFGPQKGADADTIRRLTERLDDLARQLPRDPRGMPHTGAAGGLAGGLWAALGAKLVPGAAWVLDTVDFDARLHRARAVVTGEGRLDHQTLDGKLIGEIGKRAVAAATPLHVIAGSSTLPADEWPKLGVAGVDIASTREELVAAGQRLGTALPTATT